MRPKTLACLAWALATSCAAHAQTSIEPTSVSQPKRPYSAWGLGIGAGVSEAIYAGEGTRYSPIPLVTYEGSRFFWRGLIGGAHLLRLEGLVVDAIWSARMDGIERKDFGAAELVGRGIDREKLEDRDNGLDLGFAMTWYGTLGRLELNLKQDVSSASNGFEASAKYAYPLHWGQARIQPNVAVSFMSDKMADYYFGTLPEELHRGVVDYKPGSAVIPRIGVDLSRPLGKDWAFIGSVSYKFLPSEIKDSPLVEHDKDGVVSAFLGLRRAF